MMSPLSSTPPLPPSKNTPPRHDSSGCRIQEDVVDSTLLNRMREVVMTHYRNSPSAPDRPIDLTHFKETSKTLNSSLTTNNASQNSMIRDTPPLIPMPGKTDDDDDEEYVPPGLADFVANVNRELEQQQKAFLNDQSNHSCANKADTDGIFYLNEDHTFDTSHTDEHNNEYTMNEDSTKFALRKEILQRCDLLPHVVVRSSDNEELIGIDPNLANHASMWSPDIFTSPTPVNPASLLTYSQVKQQVFTSPLTTPIPPPPHSASQKDIATEPFRNERKEKPTSPLHSLPRLSMSGKNGENKPTPDNIKENELHWESGNDTSDLGLPRSLGNSLVLPKRNEATNNQEGLPGGEALKRLSSLPTERPLPNHTVNRDLNHLRILVNQDERIADQQPTTSIASAAQDTPSTLTMASPSIAATHKQNHFFVQTQQSLGLRASSPVYGYAPTPEGNIDAFYGSSLSPPPLKLNEPLKQLDLQIETNIPVPDKESSQAFVERSTIGAITRRKSYSPSAGSLLERATRRLLAASSLDESETKHIRSKSTEAEQESLPPIQQSQPITYTSSQDETKATAPSPKQKFTNRPPQNKPIKTPSPLSTGNTMPRTGKEVQSNAFDNQRTSMSDSNYTSPPKVSISPSRAVSDTPSPLSMSSPGGHDSRSAFVPSSTSRKSEKKTVTPMVPRFRTPPSPPRLKTASRFTAEAAERLSKPIKTPQPEATSSRQSTPHYASPLKKSVNASNYIPSTTVPSQVMRTSPMISPPVRNQESVQYPTAKSSAQISFSSINRLSAPSSTESRRRSAVERSKTTDASQTAKKIFSSPPLIPSSSTVINTSTKTTHAQAGNDSTDGSSSRRRSKERIARRKSLKSDGRHSPMIAETQPSKCDHIERNSSHETVNNKTTPPSYKLSTGFEKSFRLSVSNANQDKPQAVISNSCHPKTSPTKSKNSSLIDRLSRPTQARAIAINCTLHPPPPDDEVQDVHIAIPEQRSPSPFLLSTIERLSKPTVARKAAMHTSAIKSHHPPPLPPRKEGSRSGVSNSVSNPAIESPKLPRELDSSSHLLTGTAVSKARKTSPRKVIMRPPTPTRFVSGASDRLTKPTASYRASLVPRSVNSSGLKPQSGNIDSENTCKAGEKRHPALTTRTVPKATSRTLTIPRGPRCANLPPSNKQKQLKDCIDSPSLAQVLNSFGKGLRDDFSVGSAGSDFSRRSLTIPTGPKLATDIRGGEKYKPPKIKSDVSLAESTTVLQGRLRSPYCPMHRSQHKGPTIPISPKFSTLPSRKPPKSTVDLEVEEMEYYKNHQFKAKPPLHTTVRSTYHMSSVNSRRDQSNVPGYMRPTKATTANSGEKSLSGMNKSNSTAISNQSSISRAANTGTGHNFGRPKSISLTKSGFMQAPDDALKDVFEQATRAAKALAIREEVRQEKLAQEELERRELATFKAKPVPRTTYAYNPVIPAPTVPLVEPFSPELHTKQRMKERKAFDEYAEQERLARMEQIQAMEEMRQADEEEEINERRRLPVSEGGMIPVAAPINAVLWNE